MFCFLGVVSGINFFLVFVGKGGLDETAEGVTIWSSTSIEGLT